MQPIHGGLHGSSRELAIDAAAAFAALDQAGVRKHVEMLHDRRQRHLKRPRQLADRKAFVLLQPGNKRPPRGIGERRKDAVEGVVSIVNHLVKLSHRSTGCQAVGREFDANAPAGSARNPAITTQWRSAFSNRQGSLTAFA